MTGLDATPAPPPGPIRTAHLVIRCWEPGDAPMLKDAVDSSLPELRLWMPWALTEPSPLESVRERIAKFRRDCGDQCPPAHAFTRRIASRRRFSQNRGMS